MPLTRLPYRKVRRTRSRFVVRPLLSSAAVTHAVRARMRRPDAVDVVLVAHQLVLVVADDDGTRSRVRRAQHLHGTLTDLRALPSDGAVDLLAALSDSGNLSVFRFDDALSRFLSVRQLRLGPPGVARISDASSSTPASDDWR